MLLGVDYYPEQWDESMMDSDLDNIVELGSNVIRIAEFAWKTMEPTENNFDFSLFREVVDKCRERGMMFIMGTPGATPPLWLSHKYPDIYGKRHNGADRFHGSRQDCCYNHEKYLELATRITEKSFFMVEFFMLVSFHYLNFLYVLLFVKSRLIYDIIFFARFQ